MDKKIGTYRHWSIGLLLYLLVGCQAIATPAFPVKNLFFSAFSQTNHTLTGNFKSHLSFHSNYLKYDRNILVYLPPDYETSSRRYPVLYMHDGNNIFDQATAFGGQEWQVDEHVEQMIKNQEIQSLIVVGIYNSPDRINEYTWHPMNLEGELTGGKAADYARFMVEELKPLIDHTYRTQSDREHTAVMGSSLGGLVSFYLGYHYSDVFSMIGMVSPSIWWAERKAIQETSLISPNLKIWVDTGTLEGNPVGQAVKDTGAFVKGLEVRGYQHFKNLAYHVEPNAGHNELAWAQRVDRPLRFFFAK